MESGASDLGRGVRPGFQSRDIDVDVGIAINLRYLDICSNIDQNR